MTYIHTRGMVPKIKQGVMEQKRCVVPSWVLQLGLSLALGAGSAQCVLVLNQTEVPDLSLTS